MVEIGLVDDVNQTDEFLSIFREGVKMKEVFNRRLAVLLIIFLFTTVNFIGINFGSPELNRSTRANYQPYNSFKEFLWGGVGKDQGSQFGWNLTYFENLNNDPYPDLVVGVPMQDIGTEMDVGVVYVYYGKANTGFDDINYTNADVTIQGESLGNRFGWDVADAGDVNGDGIDDLIVGAPGIQNGRGRAYIFYGGNIQSNAQNADRIIDGLKMGIPINGFYGSAVSGAGDVNNDGYDDVIVGAPGVSQTIITYGYKELIKIYPNIWDDDPNTVDIRFGKGCNNTVNDNNTWGLNGADDGWDWTDNIADPSGLYGGSNWIDGASVYGPWEPNGPDGNGLTWNNKTVLEVTVGRNHTDNNPYGSGGGGGRPAGSAAWGIEFNIDSQMYNLLDVNSTLKVHFDYQIMDTELIFGSEGTEEASTIVSRFWNSHGQYYLGDIADRYVFYHSQNFGQPAWGPVQDSFEKDVTDLVDQVGSYYWDFGCYVGNGNFGDNEGVIAFFDNVSMMITNEKNTVIQGALTTGFGAALSNLGDLNNDGYDDFLVGAPELDGGHVALIYGNRFKTRESISIAHMILVGRNEGDRFGHSISLAGDVDNDALPDVIIGAPGGDYACMYRASSLINGLLVPNLWEKTEERDTPIVEFDAGIDTTGNTPNVDGADDGWDVWDGAYGSGGTPGSSTQYNGANTINPAQIAQDNELIIGIGDNFGDAARPDSGAYGIEFSINSNMFKAINDGGDVVVSYDWLLDDTGLDMGEEVSIKTFIRKAEQDCDLGWNLDTGGTDEVFFMQDPEDANDFFVQGCSEYFNRTGDYYVDFGVRVENWQSQWGGENAIVHFDNFGLYITPPPDKKYVGKAGSGFGASVGFNDKLNIDDYGDIIIGAPSYNSPNGDSSGAIFGFFTDLSTERIILAQNAEYVHYGENAGDKFGWALTGAISIDNDQYGEIIVSSVNYDYTAVDIGRIYVLSVTNVPRIRLLQPVGDKTLSNIVSVIATVVDPDENINTELGVEFTYSNNLKDWKNIGIDTSPSAENGTYDSTWDTSALPDGKNYFVKAWVQDLDLNKGENISVPLTIDNKFPPTISIQNPMDESIVEGKIDIKALAKDSDLDLIGGGINKNLGISYYLSKDNINWALLGIANKEVKDEKNVYSLSFDSSIYPDGDYWFRVNGTDLDGAEVSDIVQFKIDNPWREPSLVLISPNKLPYEDLKGTVKVSAAAFDFDGDINSSGVTFYISNDKQPYHWQKIGNDETYTVNSTGEHIYSIDWVTTSMNDGWYIFRAFVNDSKGKTNESIGLPFKLHNLLNNPPTIELVSPRGGQILDKTQVITARVRDLEGNIDPNGVFYYYTSDMISWKLLGNIQSGSTIRVFSYDDFDYYWATDTLPDGEYYINVSVSDIEGLTSWDVLDDPVIVHNSNMNPPSINILAPTKGQIISGTFNIQAYAYDLEKNIDTKGVTFSVSNNKEDWITLESVGKPLTNTKIYEYAWDTTDFNDGKYWVKGEVKDTDALTGIAISDHFYIHNSQNNPPLVEYLWPQSGEVNGTVKINASVFDLENNLDEAGVTFEYSTNKKTWTKIGNDPTGRQSGDELIYELNWDTTTVVDNIYWLRARATDLTLLEGFDISDDYIIVHNNRNNKPIIRLIAPLKGDPLTKRENLVAEVIDFENDVASVSFFYSKDNKSWILIDTKQKPETENRYRTIWSTEEIDNGLYYIKIKATDLTGNIAEFVDGTFEVNQGKTVEKDDTQGGPFDFTLILIIIILVVVMILVIAFLIRRSKKREEQLIEEVAAEAQMSKVLEGEVETSQTMFASSQAATPELGDGYQTYIPPQASQGPQPVGLGAPAQATAPQLPAYEPDVETIESYKQQLSAWAMEGYNVIRLEEMAYNNEDMFIRTFPIFSSNINRLKEISRKLDSMDSVTYNEEISSIRSKLYEPDQALLVDKEFKELEAKSMKAISPMATSPGAIPQSGEENIDDMIPQLLPGNNIPQNEPGGTEVGDAVDLPQDGVEPVQESEVPADIDLPPDLELPDSSETAKEAKKEE